MMSPEPQSRHHGRLQAFAAALLRHEGALVEPIEPDGLDVLAPAPVQQALHVGEMVRLGFGVTLPPGAQRVGLEGDWLERFAALLGSQGRWSRRVLAVANKAPGTPETVLDHDLVLDNATFRLLDVSPAWTRYLVLDFRASAVSDDKRDFLLQLGLNLATGAMPDSIVAAAMAHVDLWSDTGAPEDGVAEGEAEPGLPDDAVLPDGWPRAPLLALIGKALTPRLDQVLEPFIRGLRRRLGRDQDRLYGYHNDLHREALQRALALAPDDPKRQREELRAEAIGREYHAKLDDLARQFATRVTVEWFQTLDLVMPVQRFKVQVRRRKADRILQLDWNPLVRRLEPPLCEWSASAERPRLVCDDALHLVIPAGLAPCVNCQRAYCRACHPDLCPRCGHPSGGKSQPRQDWA